MLLGAMSYQRDGAALGVRLWADWSICLGRFDHQKALSVREKVDMYLDPRVSCHELNGGLGGGNRANHPLYSASFRGSGATAHLFVTTFLLEPEEHI